MYTNQLYHAKWNYSFVNRQLSTISAWRILVYQEYLLKKPVFVLVHLCWWWIDMQHNLCILYGFPCVLGSNQGVCGFLKWIKSCTYCMASLVQWFLLKKTRRLFIIQQKPKCSWLLTDLDTNVILHEQIYFL